MNGLHHPYDSAASSRSGWLVTIITNPGKNDNDCFVPESATFVLRELVWVA
jgi:hypothetical protein